MVQTSNGTQRHQQHQKYTQSTVGQSVKMMRIMALKGIISQDRLCSLKFQKQKRKGDAKMFEEMKR